MSRAKHSWLNYNRERCSSGSFLNIFHFKEKVKKHPHSFLTKLLPCKFHWNLLVVFFFKYKLKLQTVVLKTGWLHHVAQKAQISGLQALLLISFRHKGRCTKAHSLSKLATISFLLVKAGRMVLMMAASLKTTFLLHVPSNDSPQCSHHILFFFFLFLIILVYLFFALLSLLYQLL